MCDAYAGKVHTKKDCTIVNPALKGQQEKLCNQWQGGNPWNRGAANAGNKGNLGGTRGYGNKGGNGLHAFYLMWADPGGGWSQQLQSGGVI